jgi:hypothetical protein
MLNGLRLAVADHMRSFLFGLWSAIIFFNNPANAVLSGIKSSDDFLESIIQITSKSSSSSCTGVLFETNKIITAFHCILSKNKNDLVLRGSFCEKNDSCRELLKVKKVSVSARANLVYHQDNLFDVNRNLKSERSLLQYLKTDDFAIIELDRNLEIQPIPLIPPNMLSPFSDSFPSVLTLFAGYGYYTPENTLLSNSLYGIKHYDYFIVERFDKDYFVVLKNSLSSVAKGDSGGGLIVEINERNYIYGILSGYGSNYGLLGSIKKMLTMQRENGFAIPISEEFLKEQDLEDHKPQIQTQWKIEI